MYSPDYFALIDTYGASRLLFGCPSNPPGDGGELDMFWGVGPGHPGDSRDEQRARNQANDPRLKGLNPWEIEGIAWPFNNDNINLVSNSWVQHSSYQWMGASGVGGNGARPELSTLPPWQVYNLSHRLTSTQTPGYPGNADYDANPPLASDIMWYQRGIYFFNHGKSWTADLVFNDPYTFNGGLYHAPNGHRGDVKGNVLYRDGHVELKSPDNTSYFRSGADQGFFR